MTKKIYDARQRAERVLVSQGRAAGMLDAFRPEMQEALAKLCGEDGVLLPGARAEAQEIINDYYDSQKAVVEPEE